MPKTLQKEEAREMTIEEKYDVDEKGAEHIKRLLAATGGKRRWISECANQQMIEPHKERRTRDPQTGDVTRVLITADGSEITDVDLRIIRFRPMHLAFPCDVDEYEFRATGVVITDDPREIAMLEKATKAAADRKAPKEMREYPPEKEIACMSGAKCTGHLDRKLAAVHMQE
ncbi:MAG: hypothetical protein ACYTEQ_16760 [Planctomycetota bacterium]|jgi:hypothetical protein